MNEHLIQKNQFEILIVDDAKGAAEDYAKLIKLKYDFKIAFADDPELALTILKENSIRVAILDQVMPLVSGTELFKLMKKINPYLKVLMFSAEASPKDYVEASSIGYDALLDKIKINELADKVFSLYTKFQIEQEQRFRSEATKLLLVERSSPFFFHRVEYFMAGAKIINEQKVFDEEWRTISELNAGQEKEIEESFEYIENIKFENSFSTKITSEFGLSDSKLELLKLKMNNEVANSISIIKERKLTTKKIIKSIYKLPSQPDDITQQYIVKRKIEGAPVYFEISAILYKVCKFCNCCMPYHIVFYKQKAEYATRQIDILSNSDEKKISTGVTRPF